MGRNVIAIIGSAGKISGELRQTVENLSRALSDAGFDLVTGGMDGVMRAVARGHGQSAKPTNLVHIEPGWGRSWAQNPHPASTVRTDLGSMRNHVIIRSADLVVSVSGGSGTLSELAIAWQEGKPIAAMRGSGGWSTKLAGLALDHRRGETKITPCDTTDEVVSWATRLRPDGMYKGRVNRGFYPLEVPLLYRIHEGTPKGGHLFYLQYGRSINKSDLTDRLRNLNRKVENWNLEHDADTVALVTFDEGWADVLNIADEFSTLPQLCPVLFVGENHFVDPVRPLPLQRLHSHCAERNIEPEDVDAVGGVSNSTFKTLSQEGQHDVLDRLGVTPALDPDWLLSVNDIAHLKDSGWIVASYGCTHANLHNREELERELRSLSDSAEERGHMPWLAWPEGRWTQSSREAAHAAGFHLQFGLDHDPFEPPGEGMVTRMFYQ